MAKWISAAASSRDQWTRWRTAPTARSIALILICRFTSLTTGSLSPMGHAGARTGASSTSKTLGRARFGPTTTTSTRERFQTIGPVTASAIAASVQDVSSFSGSREFSAYLGLTPRQNSSGGKERLGRVSKMGNRYLRKLLVVGAHAVLYNRKGHDDALRTWACKLMETKPFKLVAVALANKLARIAFAVMRDQTPYSAKPFSPAQA